MIAFDASGNVKWTIPGYNADMATADGGIVADTGTVCTPNGCTAGTAVTFDANGNATGQMASSPGESWTGESYATLGGSISDTGQQLFDVDVTSYSATAGGNPSQNGTAVPECPCEVQTGITSTASKFSFPKPQFANGFRSQSSFTGSRLMLASYPAHRVALLSPFLTFPSRAMFTPQLGGGSQVTDLLVVGDPGGTANDFETAAQTLATVANLYATNPPNASNPSLLKSGDFVIPGDPTADPAFPKPYFLRVHSVSDIATQLANNNLITGAVVLFMHGGTSKRTGESALFPYQPPKGVSAPNSALVSYDNLAVFQGAQLGPKASLTLYACHGGRKGKNPADSTSPISIAQALANTLNVTVYAWKAGMFFDVNPATTAMRQSL